jgi:hypothetical protein
MCKKDYQSLVTGNIYNFKMNGNLSCYTDSGLDNYGVLLVNNNHTKSIISFKMVRRIEKGFTTLEWMRQPYLYDYFYTLEEMRDLKINSIFT